RMNRKSAAKKKKGGGSDNREESYNVRWKGSRRCVMKTGWPFGLRFRNESMVTKITKVQRRSIVKTTRRAAFGRTSKNLVLILTLDFSEPDPWLRLSRFRYIF